MNLKWDENLLLGSASPRFRDFFRIHSGLFRSVLRESVQSTMEGARRSWRSVRKCQRGGNLLAADENRARRAIDDGQVAATAEGNAVWQTEGVGPRAQCHRAVCARWDQHHSVIARVGPPMHTSNFELEPSFMERWFTCNGSVRAFLLCANCSGRAMVESQLDGSANLTRAPVRKISPKRTARPGHSYSGTAPVLFIR